MKKLTLSTLLLCLLFICPTGCARDPAGNDPAGGHESGIAPDLPGAGAALPENGGIISGEPADEPLDDENFDAAGRFIVADAPMYRGTVVDSAPENGIYKFKLESAPGTNFGYPSILMHTDENTRTDFSLEDIALGDYLEVFYADRNNGLPPVIIAANLLPPAEICIFNGELLKYYENGTLEMEPLGGGETVVFNFDSSTSFYIDKSGLVQGVRLNIFHRGVFTRSIPPQGFAMEVRSYTV